MAPKTTETIAEEAISKAKSKITTPVSSRTKTPPRNVEADFIYENTLFDLVPVEKMYLGSYTRSISRSKVDGLKVNWDLRAVGNLYLAYHERNGTDVYAIIDGAHRRQAAIEMGETRLPARVFFDLTEREEADLYVKFATVNKQTYIDRFRARLEAHEPKARVIEQVLREFGLTWSEGEQSEQNRVLAMARTENIYDTRGVAFLREMLSVLHLAWGKEYTHTFGNLIMNGMALFWERYRNLVDTKRLIQRLHETTPDTIIRSASSFRESASLLRSINIGQDSGTLIGLAIAAQYNKGLQVRGMLPEWPRRSVDQREEAREKRAEALKRANATRSGRAGS